MLSCTGNHSVILYFSLFNEKDKDLYYTMKDNNVCGPSIIFNRYHEKDKTRIRDAEMTKKNLKPKPCKKVVGYDANALYLWAIMQDMPTGSIHDDLKATDSRSNGVVK